MITVTDTTEHLGARTPRRQAITGSPDTSGYRLEGGPVGCLIIHGWSGHPGELRPMADYLHSQGLTVYVPQLAGHGGAADALADVSFRHWIASATAEWRALHRGHPLSFVVGLSMGGALALDLAVRLPAEVSGVVTLAALTTLPHRWQSVVLPLGHHVIKWHYPFARVDLTDPAIQQRIAPLLPGPDVDFDDPRVQQQIRGAGKLPTAAVYQLQLLLRGVRRRLPAVRAPLLVMHGRLDDFIVPRNADIIYRRAGSPDKHLLLLDHSHHMLPTEPDHQEVWERTWHFIQTHAPASIRD